MRWFKHDTDAHNDLKMKLLVKKYGMEGYGVYWIIVELIGEFVEAENQPEWGMVDKLHSLETLSEECHISLEKFVEIIKYCDEIELFQKKENRLYCRAILKRLDDYAERIKAKNKGRKRVGTKSEQSRNSVRTKSDIDIEQNRTDTEQIQNRTEQNKTKPEEKEKGQSTLKKINSLNLTKGQIMVFLKEFPGLDSSIVKEQSSKCSSYMAMSSSDYTNPGLFFRGWMNKFYAEWKTKQLQKEYEARKEKETPVMTQEQIDKNRQQLKDIKVRLPIKNISVIGGAN